jgi:hypothetical protein
MKTALIILGVWVALLVLSPLDDTDEGNFARSGMVLHTDNATGCQYLSKVFGGIVPRLNADGSHKGCHR